MTSAFRMVLVGSIAVLGLVLASCSNDEMEDLASAQDCLNKITDANNTDANECFNKVAQYDSPHANQIKCAAKLMAGGLTTGRIVSAVKKLNDDDNQDKEMVFIAYLGLTPLTTAEEAVIYCRKAEISSYTYFGELAVVASVIKNLNGDNTLGETPTQAEIEAVISECQADPPPAKCKPEILAPAVISIAETYCDKPSTDKNEVCTDIEAALAEAGNDQAKITSAITCLLDGKTYTAGGGCV